MMPMTVKAVNRYGPAGPLLPELGIIVPKSRYKAVGMSRNGAPKAGARNVRRDSYRASVM
jgi:hypothetical protein